MVLSVLNGEFRIVRAPGSHGFVFFFCFVYDWQRKKEELNSALLQTELLSFLSLTEKNRTKTLPSFLSLCFLNLVVFCW